MVKTLAVPYGNYKRGLYQMVTLEIPEAANAEEYAALLADKDKCREIRNRFWDAARENEKAGTMVIVQSQGTPVNG